MRALLPLLLLTACTDEAYVIVTVTARPAVHDAARLAVTLGNAGVSTQHALALDGKPFPVTFSVNAAGRTGDLTISADALDPSGAVVGRGTLTTSADAGTADLTIDSADFVANTDFADGQFPADDFEAAGFQLAALPDGTWTVAFRDACPSQSCSVYARRFNANGIALSNSVTSTTAAFTLTTKPTTAAATPALAASATTTLAVWDFYDAPTGINTGVACRGLDANGTASPMQAAVATDGADVVALAPMATGNFVAAWNANIMSVQQIRTVIIKPDCTALGGVQSVSTSAGITHRSAVAASGDKVLFTWINGGVLYARMMSSGGVLAGTADAILVNKTATDQVVAARVAPAAGGGFLLGLRWGQNPPATGAGRIELLRVDATGAKVGTPILVNSQTVTDADNRQAFSMATGADGSVMVAWHTCGDLGDGAGCGVFGRKLRDTGEPLTDVFNLATTTTGDQKLPSVAALPAGGYVAAWSDNSGTAPDTSSQAVRARIIY